MRPIRLTMSAFGPFAAEEKIDFSALGDNPLFLINGPTGSGKSTILDAICFALYGETTGNERDAKQMRCDQAAPELLTEVTLEFQIASGIYRITRIPDQKRPKSRGEGETEQKARAELYKIDGESEKLIVAPKITEATSEIINLTGLSAEQFRQVMVLPQGKFRDLLLAKSEEREVIFQQLFQTHVYSTLQFKLRQKANDLIVQIKEVSLKQKVLLGSYDLDSAEQLQNALDSVNENIKKLVLKQKDSKEALKISQDSLQQAQILEKSFLEHAQAHKKLNELKEKEPFIGKKKSAFERAKQARHINSIYSERNNQQKDLAKVQRYSQNCQKKFEEAEKILTSLELEKQQIPKNNETLQQISSTLVELEGYRQRSVQLISAQQRLISAEKEQNESNKIAIIKEHQLAEEKKSLDSAEISIKEQSKAILDLPKKQVLLDKLEAKGHVVRKISNYELKIDELNKLIGDIVSEEGKASVKFNDKSRGKEIYELAWQKGQAAILASTLGVGEACPVCGSEEHPVLAISDEKLPTEIELNKIRLEVDNARLTLEEIRRNKILKQEERKNILLNLDDEKQRNVDNADLSLDEISRLYKASKIEIVNLESIADTIPDLEKKIRTVKDKVKSLEGIVIEVRKASIEKNSALASAKADVLHKQAELPELYQDSKKLEEAVTKNTRDRDQLKEKIENINIRYQNAKEEKISCESTLLSAMNNVKLAEIKLSEITNSWENNLSNSAFVDEQAFVDARLEENEEKSLETTIRAYDDSVLLAKQQLAEKKEAINEKQRPDIDALAESEKNAAAVKNEIDSEFHKISQHQVTLKSTAIKLKKTSVKKTELEVEYGVVGKLSNISNGNNPHNLSLQRFVLSVLLDDVLTEASQRLVKMSKGRYQLYRKETVGDKRSKSGLELEVEDAYTGKQRPAATLSGGESFMAALALALGLSDVVQAYAGGIRLDTLFIDEGFGSLDPESLDLAINTLLDLRASGRMVGIISHVEEMKRIIDVRLDVVVDRGVSCTRLVGV